MVACHDLIITCLQSVSLSIQSNPDPGKKSSQQKNHPILILGAITIFIHFPMLQPGEPRVYQMIIFFLATVIELPVNARINGPVSGIFAEHGARRFHQRPRHPCLHIKAGQWWANNWKHMVI